MTNSKLLLNYLSIGIITIFTSCSSTKKVIPKNGIDCKENLEFKTEFFENIQNVENLIYKSQGEALKN